MSVFVWLIGLPVPVLLALVVACFLFLCFLLALVAFDPTASERIARFVGKLLKWYDQAGEYRARRIRRQRSPDSGRQADRGRESK